jgi:hypothetical protein
MRLFKKYAGNSPKDEKSQNSKKSRGKREKKQIQTMFDAKTTAASGGVGSVNESQIHLDVLSQEKEQNFFVNTSYNTTQHVHPSFSKVKRKDFTCHFASQKMISELQM